MIGSSVGLILLTITLLYPRLWPEWKEHCIEQSLAASNGPAFWWPQSWRDDYEQRRLANRLYELVIYAGPDSDADFDVLIDRVSNGLPNGDDSPKAASRLAVVRQSPDFFLTDQNGETFRMGAMKDNVLLVSFIFTTCNGSCPATTHRMSLVQRELKTRGLLKDGQVRLVSITLDPERDSPEVLARYMRLYDADPETWSFLSGPPDDVRRTIAAWDMWVRPAANGQLDHPSRIFLVDPKGRIREIYNLSFMRPDWVADDVKLLLDEE